MKVLHFSDYHLGVENYGRIDPATGLHTRTIDALKALDELVDYALGHSIDLVLFAGDAYKNREPSPTHQREFAKRIAKLASAGLPVYLLVGNHDLPNSIGRATAIEIFDTLAVPKVHVVGRFGTAVVQTRSGPLQITGVPWVRRSALLGQEEAKGLTIEQTNALIEEKLTALIQREAQRIDPAVPAVLTAHLSLSTARYGSERGMMVGWDYRLLQSTVTGAGYDYVALGHIHKRQQLSQNPPVVYPGSLQRVDFSEGDEPSKGFYVATLDPGAPRGQRCTALDFHPVTARELVSIEVAVKPQDEDPTQVALNAIRRKRIAGAIVRVHITLPADKAPGLRDADIHKALAEAHYVAGVAKTVERGHRSRLGADVVVEKLRPIDALQRYLEAKSTPSDKAERLLARARALTAEAAQEATE